MKKFILRIALYTTLAWGLNMVLGHWLSTYETVDLVGVGGFYPALRWNEYYELQDSIDLLVLGSSHAYRSYHPHILQASLPDSPMVFNFGSSGQSVKTSYFILNDVLQQHRPKVLVLDIFIMTYATDESFNNGRLNYSAMQDGPGRKALLQEGFTFEQQLILRAFPVYQYRGYFDNKMKKLLGRKVFRSEVGNYLAQGFVVTNDTLSISELKSRVASVKVKQDLSFVDEENWVYFEKLVQLCAKNEIELVLMSAPMTRMLIDRVGVYDQANALVNGIAQERNIPYYDHIYHPLDSIRDEHHFYDDDHMNAAGAAIYSRQVAKYLQPYFE